MHAGQLAIEMGDRRQGGDARVGLGKKPRQGGRHGGSGETRLPGMSGGGWPGGKKVGGESQGGEGAGGGGAWQRGGSVERHGRLAGERRGDDGWRMP